MKATKWLGTVLGLSISLAHADNVIPYGVPNIDGVLNPGEWPAKSHVRMARFYGSDQFADFWLQWDENNLYIAGLLQDYTLFQDGGGDGQPWETWQDDSIEIYFHPSAMLSADPNQNPTLDQNSRVLAFSMTGQFQRLDRGGWNSGEGNTAALEILGNTNAKIGNQFLNNLVRWDWACSHVQPAQPQPAQVIVRFASQINGTSNVPGDRDQDWRFEVAWPWNLLGTTVSPKIVGGNCLMGTGVMPSKLTPTDGMSLRLNFFRVNDDNGGAVQTTSGAEITDLQGNLTSNGVLIDEWFVSQGDRYHPKEWENFILSDQRVANSGPTFFNTTLNAWATDGWRVRLGLTAPHRTAAGGGHASRYDIRTQLGAVAVDETVWAGMQSFENAYQPATPDTFQSLDVIGLQPGQTYTIAVRAVDEVGRVSPQILSATVSLWPDESKFVTVSPTGRNLVFTDGTPFVVVGETALMPWLPLRGLYNGELCDEHYPEYIKDTATPCSNGSIEGRLRNYHTEKIFYRCYFEGHEAFDIADNNQDGPDDNCKWRAANELGIEESLFQYAKPLEGPQVAEEYFAKLQASGVNVLTVFVESLDLDVTPIFLETSAGQYNPAALEFLDRLVYFAKKYDVYLILRLYDTYYYKDDQYNSDGRKWADTYWARELGKPSPDHFFDEDLYEYHKARMNVLLQRYSGERHILGWDLLNEIDNKQRFNYASYDKRKKWVQTMLTHARSVDPYHLLFFSFLAWDPKDDDYYRTSEGGVVNQETMTREKYLGMDADFAYRVSGADMAVLHGYYAHIAKPDLAFPTEVPYPADYAAPLELARGVSYGFHQIRDGRPILDGEGAPSPLFLNSYNEQFTKEQDKELLLNSMWLHFVSGGAGANLRWPIDLDSDDTINQFPDDWRFLLKIFKDNVGNIPWRGHYLKISRRDLGNGIIAATRYDGRHAVTYFYNPNHAGLSQLTLPEIDVAWGEVKAINPRTGEVLLSQGALVGGANMVTIPPINDHLVLMLQRKTGNLFADRNKASWSKSADTHVDIWVTAFPFEQEDIHFWLEDSNQQRRYFSEKIWEPELVTQRRPAFRHLDISTEIWDLPLIKIPMALLEVGQHTIGVEVGPIVSTSVFQVTP